MKTVVGLFDERAEAQRAMDDLKANGFDRNEITMVSDANTGAALIDRMTDDMPRGDVAFYREGVRRGGHLVIVRTADSRASEAARIMAQYKMVDVDTRSVEYRTGGSDVSLRDYDQDDYVLPVVEEELQVGKRAVERGRMRIYTHVTERPVEEQVRLREESVHVERRPVDRPLTGADATAFQDRTVEMTATAEEAVVAKTARVIEEVVVGKTVDERVETVRDTVRRTDVDVEQLGAERAVGASGGYDTFDNDFRTYYTSNLANSGYTYEQYSPVFRYGHSLGTNEQYHGKDWSVIERDARRDWEERNPGTWDQFRDSVRYAWERARGNR